MSHLSADAKHAILLEYAPRSRTRSFSALARRHSVSGGSRTVSRWHQRWNGSAASLQEQQRSGRPRKLNSRQVQQHVRRPILAANRKHRPVSYTQLLPSVQAATATQLSLRTLRRYGKEELRVKSKATKKRTAVESESPQHTGSGWLHLSELGAHSILGHVFLIEQCLPLSARILRRFDASCSESVRIAYSSSMRLQSE